MSIKDFNKEQLVELVSSAKSKTEFANLLGFKYYNGYVKSKIDPLIEKFSLDTSHFDPSHKSKERAKYKVITKVCPVCSAEFTAQQGHKKEKTVCSRTCSNTYFHSLRYNEDSNKKRSDSLTKDIKNSHFVKNKRLYIKKCIFCNIKFETQKKTQRFCSQSCAAKYNWKQDEYRENLINQANERVKNGTHSGWQSRTKVNRSFPEKYTIKILDQLDIDYISEYKVGKWFIDFADVNRKIAFEVDGKQHDLPERKKSDQEKDSYLKDNGWTVKRYRWKRIKTLEDRKKYISTIKSVFLYPTTTRRDKRAVYEKEIL